MAATPTISHERTASRQAAASGQDSDRPKAPPVFSSRRRTMADEGGAATPLSLEGSRSHSAEAHSGAAGALSSGANFFEAPVALRSGGGKPSNPFETAISVPFGRVSTGPGWLSAPGDGGELLSGLAEITTAHTWPHVHCDTLEKLLIKIAHQISETHLITPERQYSFSGDLFVRSHALDRR